ncbi:MAG: hypothetical protein AW08_00895 [Candidatus Accumulibacter adjunctus]|uniref:Tetratricopeptide repeat protein n=1 Tax=Candidatus Accumulibacter adjunctus TaxID=1454001 RepID=A0A011MFJ8_9PROT|nr:MAG: hypothetical protein AW08_00895 [Candidatus Accumulibacter adjunctus]
MSTQPNPHPKAGAGETASNPAPRRRAAPAKQSAVVLEARPEQAVVPYDESLLERARTQWQFGDWRSLAQLTRDTLQHHPDRAKLTLLAAAGRLQIGQEAEAKQFLRLAQDWGVSKRLISQFLIAGVHNSLGRAAAIGNRQPRALQHFENAIAVGTPGGDLRLLAQARIGEQMQQLKLLSQQAQFLQRPAMPDEARANKDEQLGYPVRVNLLLDDSATTRIELNSTKSAWLKVFPEAVEYQTDKGSPLYLVSNESGDFEKPPGETQLPLRADTPYLISGKIGHAGDNRPIIWIFQYAGGKKIDAQSISAEAGRFEHRFTTKSTMDSFAIGIRLSGHGRLLLPDTLINLKEQTKEALFAQFEEKIEKLKQAQKSEVESSMKQIEACIRLQHYLGPDTVLPDMHNWFISPDFAVLLINIVEQNEYDAVIEFGSGTSTIILAKALGRVGQRDGREPSPLLSFDHLQEYSEKTQKLLKQARVASHTQVVLAPLVAWQDHHGTSFNYYACDEALVELRRRLPDSATRILVLVDGPPAATGRHARYPALPKLLDVFPPDEYVSDFLLDDYLRTDEQEIATRWLQEMSERKLHCRRTEFNNLEKKAFLIEVSRGQTGDVR